MHVSDRLDPRARLVLVMSITTLAILWQDMYWLGGLLGATLLLLVLFGADLGQIFPRIRRFLGLLLVLLVVQSVFAPAGTPLLSLGQVHLLTTGGILKGVTVVLRMLVIVTSAMLLLTADPMRLVLGLVKFRVPYELAFMVLLAIRFLPVLMEEVTDALTAIQLRGVNIKKIPVGQKIKIYTCIFMPVAVGALLKAKKTAMAMESRAFRAFPQRTYLQDLSMARADYLVIFLSVISGGICCALYFWGR